MTSSVLKTRSRQYDANKSRPTMNSKLAKLDSSRESNNNLHLKKKKQKLEELFNSDCNNIEKLSKLKGTIIHTPVKLEINKNCDAAVSDIESDLEPDDLNMDYSIVTASNSKFVFDDNNHTNYSSHGKDDNLFENNVNEENKIKKSFDDNIGKVNELEFICKSSKDIIGEGYIGMLHAFCRDTLFKKIKILSDEHLEGEGEIIQSCLDKIRYCPSMGNKQAVINACRSEVRKTINSRRNYVKREIGKLMTSKFELNYIHIWVI
jgi:hypothetical protein